MAATMTKRLSCFEPTFERFATVSEDSRLKIYDTRSGDLAQQLTEKDHLSIQYSAIAWGAAAVHVFPLFALKQAASHVGAH